MAADQLAHLLARPRPHQAYGGTIRREIIARGRDQRHVACAGTAPEPTSAPPGRNARGNTASIVAVIKTQGSDTKLVGQMQPYYEARSLHPAELAGLPIAPVVTQIADGENRGVMMNEFPPKYFQVTRECSGSPTPTMNVTAYLEMLAGLGIEDGDLPVLQPVLQHRVWERFQPGEGAGRLPLSSASSAPKTTGSAWTAAAEPTTAITRFRSQESSAPKATGRVTPTRRCRRPTEGRLAAPRVSRVGPQHGYSRPREPAFRSRRMPRSFGITGADSGRGPRRGGEAGRQRRSFSTSSTCRRLRSMSTMRRSFFG